MNELWYWRSKGQIRGPLVTEELEALVVQGRLSADDHVRLDGSEEWIPATEIRGLFLGETDAGSPAEAAARLLESAATRRLKGEVPTRSRPGIDGGLSRMTGALVELTGSVAAVCLRAVDVATRWLGRRGRAVVTLLACLAVLGFVASRLISLPMSDHQRLYEIRTVWKEMQAEPAGNGGLSRWQPWLLQTASDLERQLTDEPVSGSSGGNRRDALARREMLFAVRQMSRIGKERDAEETESVDRSLEMAADYLTGQADIARSGDAASGASTGISAFIAALLAADAVLMLALVVWWRRGSRAR
jgi:hypothetical protein